MEGTPTVENSYDDIKSIIKIEDFNTEQLSTISSNDTMRRTNKSLSPIDIRQEYNTSSLSPDRLSLAHIDQLQGKTRLNSVK